MSSLGLYLLVQHWARVGLRSTLMPAGRLVAPFLFPLVALRPGFVFYHRSTCGLAMTPPSGAGLGHVESLCPCHALTRKLRLAASCQATAKNPLLWLPCSLLPLCSLTLPLRSVFFLWITSMTLSGRCP